MLLSSVIIVLREVIEAALLLSILVALSKQMNLKTHWLILSLLIGSCCAIIYGLNVGVVSEWFDGVGQEVMNALLQLIIYIMLIFYMFMLFAFLHQKKISSMTIQIIMILITSLAMTREGAEILLYFLSATRSENHYLAILTGMTIGASIGVSVGFLFYYLLSVLKPEKSIIIGLSLLLLVAAGLVSQASMLLIQADWLPSQLPLWDSSHLISEKSVIGQLLYALIGYESTPTGIQASLYLSAYLLPLSLLFGQKFLFSRTSKKLTR